MIKLECDVIRDLLPSYVDGICSEASKRYIDGHITDCPECEKLMRQLRDTEFTGEKLERRAFDGYKKAKRQISRQSVSGVLLAVALGFSAAAGAWLIGHGSGAGDLPVYYGLLCCCIFCTIYFTQVRKPTVSIKRTDWVLAALSVAGTAYLTGLLFYMLSSLEAGSTPFGGVIQHYGIFARYQLNAVAVLQMILYGLLLWRMVKKQIGCGWVLCLCLTGACIAHLYEVYLGSMDPTPQWPWNLIPEWLGVMVVALVIGLVGVGVSLDLSAIGKKKKRTF